MQFKVCATAAKCKASQLLALLLLLMLLLFAEVALLLVMLLLLPALVLFVVALLLMLFRAAGELATPLLAADSIFSLAVSFISSAFIFSLFTIASWVLHFFFLWSLSLEQDFVVRGCGNSSTVAGRPPYPLLLLEPELLWIDLLLPLKWMIRKIYE